MTEVLGIWQSTVKDRSAAESSRVSGFMSEDEGSTLTGKPKQEIVNMRVESKKGTKGVYDEAEAEDHRARLNEPA